MYTYVLINHAMINVHTNVVVQHFKTYCITIHSSPHKHKPSVCTLCEHTYLCSPYSLRFGDFCPIQPLQLKESAYNILSIAFILCTGITRQKPAPRRQYISQLTQNLSLDKTQLPHHPYVCTLTIAHSMPSLLPQ